MRHRPAVLLFLVGLATATPGAGQEQPPWVGGGAGEPGMAPQPPPGREEGVPADGDWGDRPGADAPDPDDYEPALRPYGAWGADPQYGRFWRPSVAAGWQPYFDGRWGWSPWGWTWLSHEPWSWTYHYGRWSFLPAWGWVWIPGSVWGPAWVSWNWFGGYVGWAPLGYWGRPAYTHYVFVRDADFCAPYVGRRVVRYDRLPRGTLVHWRDHPGEPPPRSVIERVGRHPVTVLRDRPGASLAPWHRGGGSGPLILERDGRSGTLAPRRVDRVPAVPAPPLKHTLRPGAGRSRSGVERPWRAPPRGQVTLDRPPVTVERGGGRDAVAPRWRPGGAQPGAATWSGGRRGAGMPGGGQTRGPLTIQRGGNGGRIVGGGPGPTGGGGGPRVGGSGGLGGGDWGGRGGGAGGGGGGHAGGGSRGGHGGR